MKNDNKFMNLKNKVSNLVLNYGNKVAAAGLGIVVGVGVGVLTIPKYSLDKDIADDIYIAEWIQDTKTIETRVELPYDVKMDYMNGINISAFPLERGNSVYEELTKTTDIKVLSSLNQVIMAINNNDMLSEVDRENYCRVVPFYKQWIEKHPEVMNEIHDKSTPKFCKTLEGGILPFNLIFDSSRADLTRPLAEYYSYFMTIQQAIQPDNSVIPKHLMNGFVEVCYSEFASQQPFYNSMETPDGIMARMMMEIVGTDCLEKAIVSNDMKPIRNELLRITPSLELVDNFLSHYNSDDSEYSDDLFESCFADYSKYYEAKYHALTVDQGINQYFYNKALNILKPDEKVEFWKTYVNDDLKDVMPVIVTGKKGKWDMVDCSVTEFTGYKNDINYGKNIKKNKELIKRFDPKIDFVKRIIK